LVLTAALMLALVYGVYGGLAAQQPGSSQPNQGPQQRPQRGQAGPRERVTRAVAVLRATGENDVRGTIYFTQRGQAVEVKGKIMGLEPGKHGFHVHQYGDLSDQKTGKSAGDHFNPDGHQHGRPDAQERHAGDLGNIEANASGVATVEISDTMLRLNGPQSILGRALVVHAGEDKFTQPSGDAGDRIAVGVNVIANPESMPKPNARPAAGR
jgi:Cu-Zn family superoxide dismutase